MTSRQRSLTFLFLCAIVLVIVTSYQRRSSINEFDQALGRAEHQPSIEDPDHADNPNARWAWEVKRLADPATGRIPPDIRNQELAFAADLPRRLPGMALGGVGSVDKSNDWSYRGPANVGGRTRALALDVADPALQTLVAGGVSGGMWRSEDDGDTWVITTGSSQLHAISSVAQDTRPGHEHVWYYGTGEARIASPDWNGDKYWGDGLFKSTDGARSWTQLASTSSQTPQEFDQPWDAVWRVAVDPSNLDQDEVYAATYGIIYRSIDGGESWTAVLGDEAQLSQYTEVIVDPDGVVYAALSTDGGEHGIFRSPDGLVWNEISPAGLDPAHGRITMAAAPSDPSIVYFLVANPTSSYTRQFWRYDYLGGDGSGTNGAWDNRSAALDLLPNPYNGNFTHSMVTQRGYNLVVAVNPLNPEVVYLGAVHLWRNTTGFANYQASARVGGWLYEGTSHHADQHCLVFRPGSNQVAYTGSDGGVHRTDLIGINNVTWNDLNNGYDTCQFYTVAIDQEVPDDPVVLGGTQDNGTQWTRSADGAAPWTEILGGDGAHCAVLSAAEGDYLASIYFGCVYRMLIDPDGAVVEQTRVDPTGAQGYQFINPFIIDPVDEHIMYIATSYGVWRNSDITLIPWGRWSPASEGWAQLTTQPAGELVTALAINDEPGSTLYYGTEVGGLYAVPNGRAIMAPTVPIALHEGSGFPEGGYLSGIAVHPDDDDRLVVCFGNYRVESLWYSDDGGSTWSNIEGNLAGDAGPSIRCVAVFPEDGTDLWMCGTSTGMYSLRVDPVQGPDDQPEWIMEAPDLVGNVVVDGLAVRLSDRKIVAATHGRGIFSANVGTTTDVPVAYGQKLRQNMPNPFNPVTDISFSTAMSGMVRLSVHDLQGRLVRELHAGALPAGDHTRTWRGDDSAGRAVASGVYFYRLETSAGVHQRKMTLVR